MKNLFKFICCGNVDDGKSTLIGRLLLDTNNVKKDQLTDALKASERNGSDKIELAMLLDGLLAEREQQITIDIAHRFFDYQDTRFHILDCPGHEQYTKNMAIAAAEADTAIVVIDITKGIKPQTLKHIEICSLFHIKNLLICLTKADLITWAGEVDENKLLPLKQEIESVLKNYTFKYQIIPVSAVSGYNIKKVLSFLTKRAIEKQAEDENNNKKITHVLSSKLYQGTRYYYAKSVFLDNIAEGDTLTVYPQNSIVTISKKYENGAFSILQDVDISNGDVLTNTDIYISNIINHKSIWFEKPSESMLFKHGTVISRVIRLSENLLELDKEIVFNNIDEVKQNGIGIFIDEKTKRTLGCSVFLKNKIKEDNIIKTYIIVGGTHEDRKAEAEKIKNKFSLNPFILDNQEVKVISKDILLSLISTLNKQGFTVICLFDELNISSSSFKIIDLDK